MTLTRAGDATELTTALLNRGYLHIESGNHRRAREDLARCAVLAREHGLYGVVAKTEHNLALLEQFTGDLPAALARFDTAAEQYRRHLPGFLPVLLVDRARALLAAGLVNDADAELADALLQTGRQKLSLDHADALLWRAWAALLAGRPAAARDWAAVAARRYRARRTEARAAVARLTGLRAELAIGAAIGASWSPTFPARAERAADRLEALGLVEDSHVARLVAVRALLAAGRPAEAALRHDRLGRRPRAARLDTTLLSHLARAELDESRGDAGGRRRQLRAGLARLHSYRARPAA